jgi:hypothetical protein
MMFVVLKILCWISLLKSYTLARLSSGPTLDGVDEAVVCMEGVKALFFQSDMTEAVNVITLWDNSVRPNVVTSEILRAYLRLLWRPEQ